MIIKYTHNYDTRIPEIFIENFDYIIMTRLIKDFVDYFKIINNDGFVQIYPKKYSDLYEYGDLYVASGKTIGEIKLDKSIQIKNILKEKNIFLNFFGDIINKNEYKLNINNTIASTDKIGSLRTEVETSRTFQEFTYIKRFYYKFNFIKTIEEIYKK